jgi:hypothetical protein
MLVQAQETEQDALTRSSSEFKNADQEPSALNVLGKMAVKTGWHRISIPAKAVLEGTFAGGGKGGAFKLTLEQDGSYELQINSTAGFSTIKGSKYGANSVNSSGEKSRRPGPRFAPPFLPFFSGVFADQPSSTQIRFVGTDNVQGETADVIELKPLTGAGTPLKMNKKTIWVSTTTSLPLQVEYLVPSDNNPDVGLRIIRRFSDFRNIAGLAIPFHQEELVAGRTRYTFDVKLVNFDAFDGGQR